MKFLYKHRRLKLLLMALILTTTTNLCNGSFAMACERLPKIVIKLTYTGPQNKTVPSLIFIEKGYEVPIEKFKSMNLYYPSDEVLSKTYSLNCHVIDKIKDSILKVPLNNGPISHHGILTIVCLYLESNNYKQMILSKPDAIKVMHGIYSSISGDKDTSKSVDIWMARTDLKRKH